MRSERNERILCCICAVVSAPSINEYGSNSGSLSVCCLCDARNRSRSALVLPDIFPIECSRNRSSYRTADEADADEQTASFMSLDNTIFIVSFARFRVEQ